MASYVQYKPLIVITDNVIIRIMLSVCPSPKSLLIKPYIKASVIVITTSVIVIGLLLKLIISIKNSEK
jgi:hypothetical protein